MANMNKTTVLIVIFLVLFSLFIFNLSASTIESRTVLFDHDGGYDDFLSLIMLLAMPYIEIEGIGITPADCYLEPATSATIKILRFFKRLDIEVSKGTIHGVNPFPREWREHAYHVDALPILADYKYVLPAPVSEPGHEFLARKLRESDKKLTVLITGPVSNIASALETNPSLSTKIEEIVWMGGALLVNGNVREHEHDGSAEWNAYWDPLSVQKLWQTDIPITIVPLDATNHVPVSKEFLKRLAHQSYYSVSDLAVQIWTKAVGPSYEYLYFMWDTLTTSYLGAPQYIIFQNVRTKVTPSGKSAGRIEINESGRPVKAAFNVDVVGLKSYLLDLFKK